MLSILIVGWSVYLYYYPVEFDRFLAFTENVVTISPLRIPKKVEPRLNKSQPQRISAKTFSEHSPTGSVESGGIENPGSIDAGKPGEPRSDLESSLGLSIEIIEPPIVLTRGIPTVFLRSESMRGNIVGRIVNPSRLISLSINGKKLSVDDLGIFQTSVDLISEESLVRVVAIDKQGHRSTQEFKFSLAKSTPKPAPVSTSKTYGFGNYHALLIGNSRYQKLPVLDTPVNDARGIEEVLREKYAFKTKLLLNATRSQILSELNRLRHELIEKDNLMIFYSGHGELDKTNRRCHWLPVDAAADNTENWISTVALTDILNVMTVKHILVVADSCYSGAETRNPIPRLDPAISAKKKSAWLKTMLKWRSRNVLSSGGLKPVMDGGGGDHSVFARAFIEALRKNNSVLEGQMLYRSVSRGIVAIAAQYGREQVPVYTSIRYSGHENGEFFFVPKELLIDSER